MEAEAIEIIDKLIKAGKEHPDGINREKFRAQNYNLKELINSLESKQYIKNENNKYSINSIAIYEVSHVNKDAEHLICLCELVFKVLRRFYLENAGESILLKDIAELADIPRSDVNKIMPFFMESLLHSGYHTNLEDEKAANIRPGEKILDYNTFSESIEDLKKIRFNSQESWMSQYPTDISESYSHNNDYIHLERIQKLKLLDSQEFDFSRLVKICSEINASVKNKNYIAVIALVRILLDHIPPIFGMTTFKQVVSNYKSGKSLKKTLEHLEYSSRNIADGNIHQPIRRRESLPTFNQVNFSQDIDRLLEEIIRVIEVTDHDQS